ncbi:hypothetical protein AMELA_G00009050 [Ameiurus melas]|uniref:Uncharacterized protein n=1 Tax=Ameiurus melas TaxID=219545 RepID=A0A7J6BGV5_AMEME|nr:hypothetical protein AMELA_G00009050 [Ameiurus melas]
MKTHDEAAIEAALEWAKAEMRDLLATGRVFKYGRLCQIVAAGDPVSRLIEELESHFLVVTDVPPPLPTIERSGPSSSRATQPTGLEGKPSESSSVGSGKNSESSGETFQCYCDTYLPYENPKQEVENVARFLCCMDPGAPSLEFVRDREKTQQFFREMTGAGLSKQTQLNYIKSLKRFLTYQTINTNLRHDDKDLHTDCREFIDYLGLLQNRCSKKVSKEITQKRHERLAAEAELTIHDCTAVLRATKEDFLAISRKMLSEKEVPEWLNKKTTLGHTVVHVKTSPQQVATFALSQDEDTKARRVFETATKSLTETEKSLEADYLTHSTATAEKHYQMKQVDNVVRGSQLLDLLAALIPESSPAARSIARSATQQKAETTDLQMDFEAAYNWFVERCPVTMEGEAPDKALRADISPSFQRRPY